MDEIRMMTRKIKQAIAIENHDFEELNQMDMGYF